MSNERSSSSVRKLLPSARFAARLTPILLVTVSMLALTGCGGGQGVPPLQHVFVVVMENQDYSSLFDSSGHSSHPYLNSLVTTKGGLATNYSGVAHPSLPNYIGMTSGDSLPSNTCLAADNDPGDPGCTVSVNHIGTMLDNARLPWKGYMESMPAPCTKTNSGTYAVRHNPFVYYSSVTSVPSYCAAHVVPYTALANDLRSAATTPAYNFIVPNVCNDTHDCPAATGDTWLQNNLPAIFNSAAWKTQASTLVLVWDESDTYGGNHVPAVVMSSPLAHPTAPGTKSAVAYNHYSMLKTAELGLMGKGGAARDAGAAPMADFFVPPVAPAPTTTSPSPSPTTAPAPAQPVPLGIGGNWTLKFTDDFNGSSVDASKWSNCYPWSYPSAPTQADCTNAGNHEQQLYGAANATTSNGSLHLTATRGGNGGSLPYGSGMVTTGGKYSFQYGVVQWRAKVPTGQGFWPALWLLPSSPIGDWPPETDVLECVNSCPAAEYHQRTTSPDPVAAFDQAIDPSQYHTYAINWQAGATTWYVDGVARGTAPSVTRPMYLLINLAVGGDWPGAANASTPFPSSFDISDVHVWQ